MVNSEVYEHLPFNAKCVKLLNHLALQVGEPKARSSHQVSRALTARNSWKAENMARVFLGHD